MTKKQAPKNKPKRHQKASILTELLMDGAASEVFISGPNGFLFHRRPDGTITRREGIKRWNDFLKLMQYFPGLC